jgi:hypothetical protein
MNHRSELIEKLLASIRLQFTWPISFGRSLSIGSVLTMFASLGFLRFSCPFELLVLLL